MRVFQLKDVPGNVIRKSIKDRRVFDAKEGWLAVIICGVGGIRSTFGRTEDEAVEHFCAVGGKDLIVDVYHILTL